MDVLFKKIYEIFQNQKISIYEILNSKDIKEMKDNIEKYKLLKNIQNRTAPPRRPPKYGTPGWRGCTQGLISRRGTS